MSRLCQKFEQSLCLIRLNETNPLAHWGQLMHICISKLTIIGSDNDLTPGWCQAIIWTNAGILLIWPLRTKFSEILMEIHTFSFKKMHLKMLSGKWRPFCLSLNVLTASTVLFLASYCQVIEPSQQSYDGLCAPYIYGSSASMTNNSHCVMKATYQCNSSGCCLEWYLITSVQSVLQITWLTIQVHHSRVP